METCATHGLRYDSSQHDGCVLCRRVAQPEGTASSGAELDVAAFMRKALIVLLVVGAAAVLWMIASSHSSGRSMIAASDCTRACAQQVEPCFESCLSQGDGARCDGLCGTPAHDCLKLCSDLKGLNPGEARFAYAVGEPPVEWSAVQPSVERALLASGGCDLQRGTYSARFDVTPDGKLRRVAVASPYEPASLCIQNHVAGIKGLPSSAHEYTFVVHGVPPPPLPPAPAPATAPSARAKKEQKPVDYLALVNELSAKQAKKEAAQAAFDERQPRIVMLDMGPTMPPIPGVPVASVPGAEPKIVSKVLFERMYKACGLIVNPSGGCADLLEALKPSLTPLPVSTRFGGSAVYPYEVNHSNLGFDCFWIDTPQFPEAEFRKRDAEDRSYRYPKLALIIASAPETAAFATASRLEPFDVRVDNAPWPWNYRALISWQDMAYGGPLKAAAKPPVHQPFGACIRVADHKPAKIYLGVAVWMDGPSGHNEGKNDAQVLDNEILAALGLRGHWTRRAR